MQVTQKPVKVTSIRSFTDSELIITDGGVLRIAKPQSFRYRIGQYLTLVTEKRVSLPKVTNWSAK